MSGYGDAIRRLQGGIRNPAPFVGSAFHAASLMGREAAVCRGCMPVWKLAISTFVAWVWIRDLTGSKCASFDQISS